MLSSGETEAKVAIQEEETMPLMEEENNSNLEKLGLDMPSRVVTTSALWSIITCENGLLTISGDQNG
jgi:hypothetical protein